MNLTHENYHTLENRCLTGSRIGDYNKCPKYFFERHVTGERPGLMTDAIIIGSAVDTWLSEGKEAFQKLFLAVPRRNKKNPPVGYTEITNAMFDEIVSICQVAEEQPAFQELASHKSQEIIQCDWELGDHFNGISFIPDWYTIDEETCIITDLKTANNAEFTKYFYHCLDFGYFDQMAIATIILRKIHPEIKHFVYRHFIIEKNPNVVPVPYVYFLDNDRVEAAANVLINQTIPKIASDKDFLPKMVDWDGAQTIGELNEDF